MLNVTAKVTAKVHDSVIVACEQRRGIWYRWACVAPNLGITSNGAHAQLTPRQTLR